MIQTENEFFKKQIFDRLERFKDMPVTDSIIADIQTCVNDLHNEFKLKYNINLTVEISKIDTNTGMITINIEKYKKGEK